MDDSAQFCPSCGRSAHAPSPSQSVADVQALAVHVRILGVLWAIYGAFEILTAFLSVGMPSVYFPMFQKMVGPEAKTSLSPDALHTIFMWSEIFAFLAGALGLFSGWMLIRRERTGRAVALLAALVSLIQVPIGTAIALYTFIKLLSASAREKYAQFVATPR
jgi:hypothetical protein